MKRRPTLAQNLMSIRCKFHVWNFLHDEDELLLDDLRLKLRPLSGEREGDREDEDLALRRGERERERDFLRFAGGLYDRGGDLLPGGDLPPGGDLLRIGDLLPAGGDVL